MSCNKSGCKLGFHVTCAQSAGLLCEEAGNYYDNVKYVGYCKHHYSKLVSIFTVIRCSFQCKTLIFWSIFELKYLHYF